MKAQPDGQFTPCLDDSTAKARPTGRDITLGGPCAGLSESNLQRPDTYSGEQLLVRGPVM